MIADHASEALTSSAEQEIGHILLVIWLPFPREVQANYSNHAA